MVKHATNTFQSFLESIPLKDVMTSKIIPVYEDEELSTVEKKFIEGGLFYLPVINRSNQLVGLVSRKYLYKTHSPRRILSDEMKYTPGVIIDGDSFYDQGALDGYILRGMMQSDPLILTPEKSLADVIKNMAQKKVGCIVIVNNKKEVLGIVTNQDVIKYLAKTVL